MRLVNILTIVIISGGVMAVLACIIVAIIVFNSDQVVSSNTNNAVPSVSTANFNTNEFVDLRDYKQNLPTKQVTGNINNIDQTFGDRTVFSWCGGCKKYNTTQTGNKIQLAAIEHRIIKTEQADLSGDGVDEEYSLDEGKLTITQENNSLWQSDNEWWVDDFFLIDSTDDGILDINFSVWKSGNFGSSKPFWEEENDMSVKNHFFVFGFKDGEVEPIWQSSNLDNPNREFTFADTDNDGQQELIVIEGEYSDGWECMGKYVAVWQWQEWGFFNEWRSRVGNYSDLEIIEKDNKSYITVAGGYNK